MLKFNKITLRNFLSFGNVPTTINLNDKPLTLIIGKNLDKGDSDKEKNGVGKSSIYNAIHFSLYGKAIGNNIKLSNIPNKINLKNCFVKLEFEKDDKTYVIERGRNPNFLKFQIGDKELSEDESQGDSKRTQDAINKVIGFDDTIFTQIILMTTYVDQFLNYGTPQQKVILEEILGISHLSLKAEILKEKIKETKTSLQQATYELEVNKKNNIAIKENADKQLASLKQSFDEWATKHNNDIVSYQTILDKLLSVDIAKEEENIRKIKEFDKQKHDNDEKLLQKQKLEASLKEKMEEKIAEEKTLEKLSAVDIEKEILHMKQLAEKKIIDEEISKAKSHIAELSLKKEVLEQRNNIAKKNLDKLNAIDIEKEKKILSDNKEIENKKNLYEKDLALYNQQETKQKSILSQIDSINSMIEYTAKQINDKVLETETIKQSKLKYETEIKEIENKIANIGNLVEKIFCPTCGKEIDNETGREHLLKAYTEQKNEKVKLVEKCNADGNTIIEEVRTLMNKNNEYKKEIERLQIESKSYITMEKPIEPKLVLQECAFKTDADIIEYCRELDSIKHSLENNTKQMNELSESISKITIPEEIKVIDGDFIYNTLEDCYTHSGKIDNLKKSIVILNDAIKVLQQNIGDIVINELVMPDLSQNTYKTEEEIINHKANVKKFTELLEKAKVEPNPYEKSIKEFSTPKLLPEDSDKVTCLETLFKHQDFLLDLLTKPTSFIRKNIIDSALPFLNAKIKYYLNKMNSLHYVEFNDDMTVTIVKNGDEYSFGNLSMGERSRISIALELSFRDVWESLNYPINLLCIDELLDNGLDTAGVESVIGILGEMKDRNVFLISHREELAPIVSHTLYVYMKHGFSEI